MNPPPRPPILTSRHALWGLFALAFAVCLPSLAWHNWPSPDAAIYYLPMIREFKEGNWSGAWFPMIPPLFIMVAGIVSATFSLPVLFSAKLVSILFFAGSVFPLYRILQPLYGRRSAQIGCLLLVFCSRLIRDGAAPLLDSSKMFLLLWSIALVIEAFRQPLSRGRMLGLAGASAGLALVRGEGVILAGLALIAFAVAELRYRNKDKSQKHHLIRLIPWQSLAVASLFILLTLPWTVYMYRQTGYPVFDSRQIGRIEHSFLARFRNSGNPFRRLRPQPETNTNNDESAASPTNQENSRNESDSGGGNTAEPSALEKIKVDILPELHKGIHRYYGPLYLIGILVLLKNKWWSRQIWLPAGIFLAHTMIMLVAIGWLWTQARYILPATPLLFGWAAVGGDAIIGKIKGWMPVHNRRLLYPLLASLAAIMVFNGNRNAYNYLRRSRPSREYASVKAAAKWLRENHEKLIDQTRPGLESTTYRYHSGRHPLVLSINRQFPFLAASDAIILYDYSCPQSISELAVFAQTRTIDFIIVDRQWRQICPVDSHTLAGHQGITAIRQFGKGGNQVQILKVSNRQPTDP